MALRFNHKVPKGASGGGTYDHNLLVNRGMPDQHTIESITGLREELNKKYEKPFSGIPRSDLGFDVLTRYDLQVFKNTDLKDLVQRMDVIQNEIVDARGHMNTLREYIDTKVSYADWNGGGGSGSPNHEVGYPLYETHRAEEGQTLFTLSKPYEVGTHQLEVFQDGLLMVEGDDYIEVDDRTVEFLYPLEKDTMILFRVKAVIHSGLHEEYQAEDGQTIFQLQHPYGIYQNILQVYKNGVLQQKGKHYREVDRYTIEFYHPLESDDYIVFHQAGASDPIADTVIESEIGRMKMNQAYLTMRIHEAIQISDTDYVDMYVDPFVTDQNIDQETSMSYLYHNQGIEVRSLTVTKEEFHEGLPNGTDISTYQKQVRLENKANGAVLHDLQAPTVLFDEVANDEYADHALSIQNNYGDEYRVISTQKANGISYLYVTYIPHPYEEALTSRVQTIFMSNGYLTNVKADTDSNGHLHIVFQEHGVSDTPSRVLYAVIKREPSPVVAVIVSHEQYDAITPDITVDINNIAHITFASKRFNANVFNIDYRMINNGTLSGFREVTMHTILPSLNPAISVGRDGIVRIVFESLELDTSTKNIKLVEFADGIKTYETFITTSTTFDNVMPAIQVDHANISRIVWRSKRFGFNYGIDYCAMYPDHVLSGIHAVAISEEETIFGAPQISVDYENISHIVFEGNVFHPHVTSICYTMVSSNHELIDSKSIGNDPESSFTNPTISAYGDCILVSYLNKQKAYQSLKKVTNFASIGTYDIVLNAQLADSKWEFIHIVDDQPEHTSISYQYRLSNDQLLWSSWKSLNEFSQEEIGRFLQIRATLETTDVNITPVIRKVETRYRPSAVIIQSKPKPSVKEVSSAIVVARYQGDVTFEISRDGGLHFVETPKETAVHFTSVPNGNQLVIRAKIHDGSRLDAWGIVW